MWSLLGHQSASQSAGRACGHQVHSYVPEPNIYQLDYSHQAFVGGIYCMTLVASVGGIYCMTLVAFTA